ncbi:MAG TPA: hypothetical protein DCM27_07305 [Rhodospirillaceae bacterium]|nr:hypothetical protein [Rhodospirillaceae bacterium]
MPHSKGKFHPVLQLHGGGTLVLSQIIKCAIIESLTGKRIPDLFPSMIADSGGAIIALGLHFKPAEEILHLFMQKLPMALPDRKFFLSQALAHRKFHFDPAALENALTEVFGNRTLDEITGNIFIRTHSIDGHAQRISKISIPSGPQYTYATGRTRITNILLKATAIPGILPEPEGKYIDTLTDQNPVAILAKLQNQFPNDQFEYVIAGTIHHNNLPESFREKSFIGNYLRGSYQNYAALHRQSAHLEDLGELLPSDRITSLVTFSPQHFSSINNSSQQRAQVILATLEDVLAQKDVYTKLARKLCGKLQMRVEQAVDHLRQELDVYITKDKTESPHHLNDNQPLSSVQTVDLTSATSYKIGYMTGLFVAKAAPALAGIIVCNDFNLVSIGKDTLQALSRSLLPSRPPIKNAADPSAAPELKIET